MDFFFHPKVVHFPIALLLIGGLVYTWALVKRNEQQWIQLGFFLHVTGWLGCIASVLSGRQAKTDVVLTAPIRELLDLHEKLGYLVAWLFAMLGIWMFLRMRKLANWEHLIFVVLFWLGSGVMGYMGHLGGKMVYEEGAGVKPMKEILQPLQIDEK